MENIENIIYNPIVRLSAGAKPEELEDFVEEETPVVKKEKVPFKLTKPIVYRLVKIVFLCGLLLMGVCFLIKNDELEHDYRLLAIAPNKTRYYNINTDHFKDGDMGIIIYGPFLEQDDLRLSGAKAEPTLTIYVERVYYLRNSSSIISVRASQNMTFLTAKPDKLEKTVLTRKKKIFNVASYKSKSELKCELRLVMETNFDKYLTVRVMLDMRPVNKDNGIICGSFILIFLYAMIIWELINQTLAAMITAFLSISLLAAMGQRPQLSDLVDWIEVETMTLLFGMMIMMAILADTGLFDYLAVFAFEKTKAKIWPLIYILCIFATFLSCLLDNVTIMLLMTPVTIRLAEVTKYNPVPILLSMILCANVGAALTPVGDPPNIIVANNAVVIANGVNFGIFVSHMVIPCIVGTALVLGYVRLYFKNPNTLRILESDEVRELRQEIHVWERAAATIDTVSQEEEIVYQTLQKKIAKLKGQLEIALQKATIPEMSYEENLKILKEAYPIRHKFLLIKCSIALGFCVIYFILHSLPNFHHLNLGWTAFMGALLLIIIADIDTMEPILFRVEWSTLLFFASLLITMEALSKMGFIEFIGNMVVKLILLASPSWRLGTAIIIILWVSGIASAILNNIPVTTMMVKIIITLSHNKKLDIPLQPLVWALCCGACFGGNGTLLGASANVVGVGLADQHGYKISFVKFFYIGFPATVLTLLMTTGYLVLCHVAFQWH